MLAATHTGTRSGGGGGGRGPARGASPAKSNNDDGDGDDERALMGQIASSSSSQIESNGDKSAVWLA